MTTTPEFKEFPKMARLSREVIITEKLDGTNASIFITEGYANTPKAIASWFDETTQTDMLMFAGSRTRWITPTEDNYGFAKWVADHVEELKQLGPGHHFGEWWGQGIQRKYGMTEKRFSLFNVTRWGLDSPHQLPACCHLVPLIYRGPFTTAAVEAALEYLERGGSLAAPGFMDPEGIMVFHTAAQVGFKKTIKNDEVPKSLVK
jgi:hypothetical protein